jgi:hypothetical protein
LEMVWFDRAIVARERAGTHHGAIISGSSPKETQAEKSRSKLCNNSLVASIITTVFRLTNGLSVYFSIKILGTIQIAVDNRLFSTF